jgi:hypothetical protein
MESSKNPTQSQPATPPPTSSVAPVGPTQPADTSGYISNPAALLKPSYKAFLVNLKSLIIAFLIPFAVALAGVAVLLPLGLVLRDSSANVIVFILGAVSIVAFTVFILRFSAVLPTLMLASAREQVLTFKAAFAGSKPYWLKLIGIYLLTALAVIGGFILFIIPGFIFGAWFLLAPFVAIDEGLGVVDSMKRSKQLIKGRLLEMWGFEAFPQLVAIVGLIPFLGSIVSFLFQLVWMPASAIRYEQLKALGQTEPKPPIHWLNYVLVVFAALALPLLVLFSVLGSLQDSKNKPTSNPLEQIQTDYPE